MITEVSARFLPSKLHLKKAHFPLKGQIELTYRCSLNCVHCYSKSSANMRCELKTQAWKDILEEIYREGCAHLTFSGGEPFLRNDFVELYRYAKKKGFLVSIFSSGQVLSKGIMKALIDLPPYSLELTLNGITSATHESITQVKGSFRRFLGNLELLKRINAPIIIKANCLKQNKRQIAAIKVFVEGVAGRDKNRFNFKYDTMIYPRLDGDRSVLAYRLTFDEIANARRADRDIWKEYCDGLKFKLPELAREKGFLYQCDSWKRQFFINPYGRLKFCQWSEKFSSDLKNTSFKDGFYNIFPLLLEDRFKTDSKCRECNLRPICFYCPARAYLETGDEESPVRYYCELAKKTARAMNKQYEK